jgi:hypothetical protein
MSAHGATRRSWLSWTLVLALCASAAGAAYCLACRAGWDVLGGPGIHARGPRLQRWATPVTDLGEGKARQVLTGTFQLRNVGSEPLSFRIEPNCSCAQCEPRQGEIPPGEVQEVVVGIRLRDEGRQEQARLRIHTNDPQAPQVDYDFKALCPAPFLVAPEAVDFGNVVEGASPRVTLRVADARGNPLGTTAELGLRSDSPHVTVERVSASGMECLVAVKLRGTAPRGSFRGDVAITLGGLDRTVRVPV